MDKKPLRGDLTRVELEAQVGVVRLHIIIRRTERAHRQRMQISVTHGLVMDNARMVTICQQEAARAQAEKAALHPRHHSLLALSAASGFLAAAAGDGGGQQQVRQCRIKLLSPPHRRAPSRKRRQSDRTFLMDFSALRFAIVSRSSVHHLRFGACPASAA